MPERKIAEMAAATGHQTFIVFAEWMKENRESWERHLAAQDKALQAFRNEFREKLEEIHTETRRTNGRVTQLEKRDELVETLAVNKKEWEAERSSHDKEIAVHRIEVDTRKSDRFWKTAQLFSAVAGGGILGGLGHAFGWW